MVQADHHAHLRTLRPLLDRVAHRLELGHLQHSLLKLLGQLVEVLRLEGQSPQSMDSRHRSDKVAIRHVCQSVEVCLVAAAGFGYLATGADPLSAATFVRSSGGVFAPENLDRSALEGAAACPFGLVVPFFGRCYRVVGEGHGVTDLDFAAGALADEADGRGEDAFSSLARLDGAGGE